VSQRDATAEISSLEQQLHTLDTQMDVADRLAHSDPSMAREMLDYGKEHAIQAVRESGEHLEGVRSGYAAVLAEASSVLQANGAPLEAPELPAADPEATQAADALKRLTDQAVLDQMAKVRAIQSALDKAAGDAYRNGAGTSEFDAGMAKVRELNGELATALDDLGNIPDYSKLDPRAVTAGPDGHLLGNYLVNGQPIQLYGQLKNGSGQIFDQARQTTYTFKDGKLVGQTRLDPGTVTPDDELLFNAVTTAVGAPEAAAGVKVVGEVGVEGFKRLLGREGFDLAASGVTSDNVIPRALAGAQLQADAAQARLNGLTHQFDAYPPNTGSGVAHADGVAPHPHPGTVAGNDVTFPDPAHPSLGSDDRYYLAEGAVDTQIDVPGELSRTITDIDRVQNGILWEEKSATTAGNIDQWVSKQFTNKMEKYLEAQQYISGFESAPIGIRFTTPGVDPIFKSAVEQAAAEFRNNHPGVNLLIEWPS
jgi:hypothetical protein